VRRYRDYESEAEAEAARRIQQAAEAGQGHSAGTAPEQQPSLVPLGLEGGCRYAHWPACGPRAALSATEPGPQSDHRQVSDDSKLTLYDSFCVPGTRRTQHHIVGLVGGRLGVPITWLPGHSCLRPTGLGTLGSADPCLRLPDEVHHRACALFASRDGAVGLIQVGADASVSWLQCKPVSHYTSGCSVLSVLQVAKCWNQFHYPLTPWCRIFVFIVFQPGVKA
jgi:hypothetical protein